MHIHRKNIVLPYWTSCALGFLVVCSSLLFFTSCGKNRNTTKTPEIQEVVSVNEVPEVSEARPDSVLAIYERTLCFGMCPYFNMKIYSSGYAVYEGKNFVDMIGLYHTTFDLTSLQKLDQTIQRIGYLGMQDEYDNPRVTDLPTVITGYWNGEEMKKVADRYKGPDELEELYQVLDEMIQGAAWTAIGK